MSEEKSARRQLTPKQWAEVESLWALGDHTLADLSREYDVSIEHLSRELKKRGVKKGSGAEIHGERIKKAIMEESEDSAKLLSKRIRETKENHYKWNQVIGKLTMSEIVRAQNDGRQFSDIQDNLKSLKLAAETLSKLRGDSWSLLGLDKDNGIDDDELPTLHIIERSDADIRAAQARGEFGFDSDGLEALDSGLEDELMEELEDYTDEGGDF